MQNIMEAPKTPVKDPVPEGTWIQITFTLDPEHYRTLWQRAEGEHRTIPGFVRESVIDYLKEVKISPRKIESFAKRNAGDLP